MRALRLALVLAAATAAAPLMFGGCKHDPTHADTLCDRYTAECADQDPASFCSYVRALEDEATGTACRDELDLYFECGDALDTSCEFVTSCDTEGRTVLDCLMTLPA